MAFDGGCDIYAQVGDTSGNNINGRRRTLSGFRDTSMAAGRRGNFQVATANNSSQFDPVAIYRRFVVVVSEMRFAVENNLARLFLGACACTPSEKQYSDCSLVWHHYPFL